MAEIKLNIEIHGTLDEDVITEEVKHHLRKEIAILKRKFAEEELAEKWAKIGRKPDEFKKGDIVLVSWTYNLNRVSALAEIYSGPEGTGAGGNYEINNGNDLTMGKFIELITPVEARFDR